MEQLDGRFVGTGRLIFVAPPKKPEVDDAKNGNTDRDKPRG